MSTIVGRMGGLPASKEQTNLAWESVCKEHQTELQEGLLARGSPEQLEEWKQGKVFWVKV